VDWHELAREEIESMRESAIAKIAKAKLKLLGAEALLFETERMLFMKHLVMKCKVRIGGKCRLEYYSDGPCDVIIEGITRHPFGNAVIEYRIIGKRGKPWKSTNFLWFEYLDRLKPFPNSPSAETSADRPDDHEPTAGGK
jgi:hypothetical protein